MKTSKIIDCFRSRYLGTLSVCTECAPEPEDCGTCQRVSCGQELQETKDALRALLAGSAVQEISEGDRRVRYYHSADSIKCLKERLGELEMKCGGAKEGTAFGCDPCGGLTLVDTFERVRPPPIRVNHRRWY